MRVAKPTRAEMIKAIGAVVGELGDDSYAGLMLQYLSEYTDAIPGFGLLAVLQIVEAVSGAHLAPGGLPTSLYSALVGATGDARKSTIVDVVIEEVKHFRYQGQPIEEIRHQDGLMAQWGVCALSSTTTLAGFESIFTENQPLIDPEVEAHLEREGRHADIENLKLQRIKELQEAKSRAKGQTPSRRRRKKGGDEDEEPADDTDPLYLSELIPYGQVCFHADEGHDFGVALRAQEGLKQRWIFAHGGRAMQSNTASKDSRRRVYVARPSLICGLTPTAATEIFSVADLRSGWYNRFVFIAGDQEAFRAAWDPTAEYPAKAQARRVLSRHLETDPRNCRWELSDEAKAERRRWLNDQTLGDNPVEGELVRARMTRYGDNINRMAVLFAVQDHRLARRGTVEARHMRAAAAVMDLCAKSSQWIETFVPSSQDEATVIHHYNALAEASTQHFTPWGQRFDPTTGRPLESLAAWRARMNGEAELPRVPGPKWSMVRVHEIFREAKAPLTLNGHQKILNYMERSGFIRLYDGNDRITDSRYATHLRFMGEPYRRMFTPHELEYWFETKLQRRAPRDPRTTGEREKE